MTDSPLLSDLETSLSRRANDAVIPNRAEFAAAESRFGMGLGELSTIIPIDGPRARRLAAGEGVEIRGAVGLLELLYRGGDISDLGLAFQQLLSHSAYVDHSLLNRRLSLFGLPPL